MKTKIIVLFLTALFLSACSSSYLAKSGNDDLYYSPAKGNSVPQTQTTTTKDVPKSVSNAPVKSNSGQMTDYERYRKSLENGEITDTSKTYADNSSVQNAADDKEPMVESNDYYGSNRNTYVDDDYYYASRMNRFHGGYYHPYFYDPFYFDSFYDPFYYSPGWSFSIGFGWGYPYYSSYYYPYYGGYWGFSGYRPYYSGYYSPYYNHYGYYDGGYYGNSRYYSRGYNLRTAGSNSNRTYYPSRTMSTERSGIYNGRSTRRYDEGQGSGRSVTRSYGGDSRSARSYTRRMTTDGTVAPSGRNGGSSADNAQSSERRNYTPSYSKPRTSSRPAYNETSTSGSESRRSSGSYGSSRSGSYSSGSSRSYGGGNSGGYSGGSSSGRSYSGGGGSSSSGGGSSSSSSGGGGGSHSSGGRR